MRLKGGRRHFATFVACVSIGTNCGGGVQRELDNALSATSSAHMSLVAWLGNRVPTPFATRTLGESSEELSGAEQSLGRLPAATALKAAVHSALGAAVSGRDAVAAEHPDTARARAAAVALDSMALVLQDLRTRMQKKGNPP